MSIGTLNALEFKAEQILLPVGPAVIFSLRSPFSPWDGARSVVLDRPMLKYALSILSSKDGQFVSYRIEDEKVLKLIQALRRIFCP